MFCNCWACFSLAESQLHFEGGFHEHEKQQVFHDTSILPKHFQLLLQSFTTMNKPSLVYISHQKIALNHQIFVGNTYSRLLFPKGTVPNTRILYR